VRYPGYHYPCHPGHIAPPELDRISYHCWRLACLFGYKYCVPRYLELHGSIPLEFRPLIGNRIYGCDDCQLFCPWNRFAQLTREQDFQVRHQLDSSTLIELFAWSEQQFLDNTAGSAIRRIGHERCLRNIAVALGNAPTQPDIITALEVRRDGSSEMVREHIQWALEQHPK